MSGNRNRTEIGALGEENIERTGRLPDDADCQLERFVRNRYFHGKLMTARDMKREQEYHADRLETLAQHTTGKGAVCGLSTTVDQDGEGEPLEITVEPGYALDCCGRPVLLDSTAYETVPTEDLPDPGETAEGGELPPGVSVYVRLKECYTEKVPINGSEDACREDCTYNRVVEDFEIVTDQEGPEVKQVRELEFPTRASLESYDEETGADPDDPGLQALARSYYEDRSREGFQHRRCGEDGDPRVFLGYYARATDGWSLVEDTAPRHYVYSNDMLYAAIVRHVTDFENPHEVLVGGDVYVRDKTLKYTIETFYEVAERYAEIDDEHAEEVTDVARQIILGARDALDEGYFRGEAAFTITGVYLASLAWSVRGALQESRDDEAGLVSDRSFEDYSEVFERLNEPLSERSMNVVEDRDHAEELWEALSSGESGEELLEELDDDIDATELAVVLDQIAEEAGWLELGAEPGRMVLPGGDEDEEIPSRIIETAIDRRGGPGGVDALDERLSRLERYVLESSLWCECAFSDLGEQFGLSAGSEIADRLRTAQEEEVYEDADDYLQIFTDGDDDAGILTLLTELADELERITDARGVDRMARAITSLQETLEEADPDAFEVAVAQNRLCESAECLEWTRRQLECVNFHGFVPDTVRERGEEGRTRLRHGGLTFTVVNRDERFNLVAWGPPEGLVKLRFPNDGLSIDVPTTSYVETEVATAGGQATLVALDNEGNELAQDETSDVSDSDTTTLGVQSEGIARVVLEGGDNDAVLLEVCFDIAGATATERPFETTIDTNTVDEDGSPKLEVEPTEDQAITGRSHLDPGTALGIRLRSTGDHRFLKTGTAIIGENFDYGSTFDFSDVESGTPFVVVVLHEGERLAILENAEVV